MLHSSMWGWWGDDQSISSFLWIAVGAFSPQSLASSGLTTLSSYLFRSGTIQMCYMKLCKRRIWQTSRIWTWMTLAQQIQIPAASLRELKSKQRIILWHHQLQKLPIASSSRVLASTLFRREQIRLLRMSGWVPRLETSLCGKLW